MRAPGSNRAPAQLGLALDLDDVRRLQALGALGRLELDLRTFGERLEAVAGDAREVNEQIGASVGRRNEAVALGVAEPLDSSGCHDTSLNKFTNVYGRRCRATSYSFLMTPKA